MKRLLLILSLANLALAQPKPAITPADFGKWETLGTGVLSPDGKWLAAPIRRADGSQELRVAPTTGGKPQIAKSGTEPAFSADSHWVAYAVIANADDETPTPGRQPVQRKLGIMNLSSGAITTVDDVNSFAFSDEGAYLAFQRYPARPAASAANVPTAAAVGGGRRGRGGGAAAAAADAIGTTLTVRNLTTEVDTTFGNVTDFKWQEKGGHLAMTIGAEGRVGNGVQVFNPAQGELKVLDSGMAIFTALAWRKDSSDLAALRSKRDGAYDGESYDGLAWKNLGGKKAGEVSAPKRVIASRAPQWSEDGRYLFVGLADWDRRTDPAKSEEEPSNVEVWHSRDVNVVSEQKLTLVRDRDRNALAAWNIDEGRVVPLSNNSKETVQLPRHGRRAIAVDVTPYETDGMFGRRYADVHKIDLASGSRSSVATRIVPPIWSSPGGHYALNFKDGEYWIYDLETGGQRNASRLAVGISFTDKEDDHPARHKPPYGVAGWTKDDASVIVYDQFDLWELFPDGSKPRRLTDGGADQVRHRLVRLDVAPVGRGGGRGGRGDGSEDGIDLSKPIFLSLNGVWSKKTGYARLMEGKVEREVWLDKGVSRLMKAKNADVYAYVVEAFDDSPNYFTAGPDLNNARQVSETNPFAAQYAWGRSQLIEYKSTKGERLQGALFYPANYQAGKQYPMLVHIYERESDYLHRYFPVSERSPYSDAVWSANGYFVLMPDIVFRPRDPGLSVVESVTAATKAVIATGMVDPKRLGIVGHSWGGFGTTFIMTQTDLFAAGACGGALTDLVSNFGEVYWNSGVPETGHMEVGQERMEVPLWEDPQAYIRNSAVFSINKMKGPLLMATADKDGASDWHQTLEFYNIARRAGKQMVMLVYPGENHSLAVKANQIDYHRRIIEWFGYYLKGEKAPEWITKGMPVLDREKELKRIKKDLDPAVTGAGAP